MSGEAGKVSPKQAHLLLNRRSPSSGNVISRNGGAMPGHARQPLDGLHSRRGNVLADPQRAPVRAVAIARRRHLAASGPMPPALACRFTVSELAVLKIVGDEVR